MPPRLVFGLLVLPFAPLLARAGRRPSGEDWLCWFALAGLGLATVVRASFRPRRLPRFVPRLFGGVVTAAWAAFFVMDLQNARFAWTLLLVPVGALLGGRRHAQLGAFVALTAIWVLMVPRAHNGCTGVSVWYQAVLLLHPVLAVWPAPFLFSAEPPEVHES